jgi:uncharacterized membrane protein
MTTVRRNVPVAWGIVLFLIAVVMVFATIRVINDSQNLAEGTVPAEGEFDRRYTEHAVLAYAHILPGVAYLVLAPFQVSRLFRNRHLSLHRKMGRVLVPLGIASGLFGIVFGILYSFGGVAEASAAVVFGSWFVYSLATAYRHIRAGDTVGHRRWMIRAFAIGIGVGTIRLSIGLFQAAGLLDFDDAFGMAFWIAWVMHVIAAELWLRWRPT